MKLYRDQSWAIDILQYLTVLLHKQTGTSPTAAPPMDIKWFCRVQTPFKRRLGQYVPNDNCAPGQSSFLPAPITAANRIANELHRLHHAHQLAVLHLYVEHYELVLTGIHNAIAVFQTDLSPPFLMQAVRTKAKNVLSEQGTTRTSESLDINVISSSDPSVSLNQTRPEHVQRPTNTYPEPVIQLSQHLQQPKSPFLHKTHQPHGCEHATKGNRRQRRIAKKSKRIAKHNQPSTNTFSAKKTAASNSMKRSRTSDASRDQALFAAPIIHSSFLIDKSIPPVTTPGSYPSTFRRPQPVISSVDE